VAMRRTCVFGSGESETIETIVRGYREWESGVVGMAVVYRCPDL
jgi:hypothetical protein